MTQIKKAFSTGNKPNEVVSVRDFGAVGDGVTDDTVAIQAALDSAKDSSSGTLDLGGLNINWNPSGSYTVDDTLIIKNGTLTFGGSALVYVFRVTGCGRFRLENLVIAGNSNGTIDDSFDATTGTYSLIQADSVSDNSISNLEIEGCTISGCIVVTDTKYQQGATGRFYVYEGYARNNYIYNVPGHAFALNLFKGFAISHNRFKDIGALAVDFSTGCKRCSFTFNRIEGAAGIGKFQSHLTQDADNYVANCIIVHNYAISLTLGNSNNVASIKNAGVQNTIEHNYVEYDGTGAAVEAIVSSGTCSIKHNKMRQLSSVTRSAITTITDTSIEALDEAPLTTIADNSFTGFNYGVRLQNTTDTNITIKNNKQNLGGRFIFIEPSVTLTDLSIHDNEADLSSTSGSMGIQASSSVTDLSGARIGNNYFKTDSNCILIYNANGTLVFNNRLHSVSGGAFVPISMTSYAVVGNYSNVTWATTDTTNIKYIGNIV